MVLAAPQPSIIMSQAAAEGWFDGVPGERIRIRVDSRTVGGRYTIIESIAQAMIGPPLHRHREDEVFLVLDGCLVFQCGDDRIEAKTGAIMVAPAGTPHCWFNFGPAPARMIATFTPGGLEEVFLGLASISPADLGTYAARHNIDVLGPPLGVAV